MLGRYVLFAVVRCEWIVIRCLLMVVSVCVLFGVRGVLFAMCWLLFVAGCLWCVVCGLLFGVCSSLRAVRCAVFVVR